MVKIKHFWRKLSNYVRYDLKEIAFPSSLPDPPHIKPAKKLTWREWVQVLKISSRLYVESWRRDISHEIDVLEGRIPPETARKDQKEENEYHEKEPSTLEDIAVAARGGMETLRPVLQRIYMTRATAYRDALKNFIEGYQEGIAETMASKESLKSQLNDFVINLTKENEGASNSAKEEKKENEGASNSAKGEKKENEGANNSAKEEKKQEKSGT